MAHSITALQKIIGFLKNFLLLIPVLVLLYFAIAMLSSLIPTHPPKEICNDEKTVFVNTNGVHVDIILPLEYLQTSFKHQLNVLPGTRYIAFGWGDRNFYIKTPEWSDLTFPVAFKALFLKSGTAMHVTNYSRGLTSWEPVNLCEKQLDVLIAFIENSFEKDEKGKLLMMDFAGYTSSDFFFKAKGSFSLFKTCNSWVNKAFKEANVKTAVWTPFDFGILMHIKNKKNESRNN